MIPLLVLPADPEDRDTLERVTAHLERGGLLVYPTETVYGIGAPADPGGVERVRGVKGRGADHLILVLLPRAATEAGEAGEAAPDPARWGLEWPEAARRLAEAFWPGPLTLVLGDPGGRFPPGVRSAEGGVAVRVSSHPFVRALLALWDRPLLSTSANRSGEPPAVTLQEAMAAVEGRPGMDRLWFVDGGRLPPSQPSTVVDCTGERPRVLRRGAVSTRELATALPEIADVNDA